MTLSLVLSPRTYRPLTIAFLRTLAHSVPTTKCCISWKQWARWLCSHGALPKTLPTSGQIAKLLGESLRQHFLNSGIPDTVKGLQATSVAMTTAQRELSTALRNLSDSRGAVAQIESANNRLTYSLDNRAKAVDALLREVKSDLLRLWIPLIAGATLLIGLFGGMGIQSWRDSVPTAATPTPPLWNRSHCPSRSRTLRRLPAQSSNAIARQRQSPVQSMSDRTTFYRSCEIFGQKKTRLRLVVSSGYELTSHKLTTHNLYRRNGHPAGARHDDQTRSLL